MGEMGNGDAHLAYYVLVVREVRLAVLAPVDTVPLQVGIVREPHRGNRAPLKLLSQRNNSRAKTKWTPRILSVLEKKADDLR